MGVSGLHTYVEGRALGRRVVLSPQETERVVILDACAGMLTFYTTASLVGDFRVLRDNVARFVARFAAVNIRLVVVIDGVVPTEKFATWLSRRRKEVSKVAQLNAGMHGGARRAA
jgi:hypothetical protein